MTLTFDRCTIGRKAIPLLSFYAHLYPWVLSTSAYSPNRGSSRINSGHLFGLELTIGIYGKDVAGKAPALIPPGGGSICGHSGSLSGGSCLWRCYERGLKREGGVVAYQPTVFFWGAVNLAFTGGRSKHLSGDSKKWNLSKAIVPSTRAFFFF